MTLLQLSTNERYWRRAYGGDAPTTSQTIPVPRSGAPTGGAIRTINANLAKLCFMATEAGGASGKSSTGVHIYSWSKCHPNATDGVELWIPTIVASLDIAYGTVTGVADAGSTVHQTDNNDFFADEITLVEGDESVRIISGLAGTIASITLDLEGAEYLEVIYTSLGGGTDPTTSDVFWALF